MTGGFVYVMRSPATPLVKIGLSTRAPFFRARELNREGGYGGFFGWTVVDYREVRDCNRVESVLHARFAAFNEVRPDGARELFAISEENAVAALIEASETYLSGAVPVGKLRLHPGLLAFLRCLFRETGLTQFLDCQEMWTLSVFNKTEGGRDFTLNIDRHEVAFARPLRGTGENLFMLAADRLILGVDEVADWLKDRDGFVSDLPYASALADGVGVEFSGSYDQALQFFELPMVRRALVAYWYDVLLNLRDREKRSFFARFHNHNAVAAIVDER